VVEKWWWRKKKRVRLVIASFWRLGVRRKGVGRGRTYQVWAYYFLFFTNTSGTSEVTTPTWIFVHDNALTFYFSPTQDLLLPSTVSLFRLSIFILRIVKPLL
jgi:hypothetical protein